MTVPSFPSFLVSQKLERYDMKQILWPLLLTQTTINHREQLILLIVFIGSGLLWIGISIPLFYRKIGPNRWCGFRTRKTLANKEIWFEANKYMAKDFIILGCIQILYNLVLIVLPKTLPFLCAGNMLILIGGTVIILIRSLLYLRKL